MNDDETNVFHLPQVSVSVATASVIENAGSSLVYTFTRTGDLSSPLSVNIAVSGTTNSADYTSSVTLFSEPTKSWTKLLGSSSYDEAHALTTGLDGSIYVSGYTKGWLDGQNNLGEEAFITKYLPDGTKSWTQLLYSIAQEQAHALTTGLDGSIYVSGATSGKYDKATYSASTDVFITKYLEDGTFGWMNRPGF
jgi:hypothetical protein